MCFVRAFLVWVVIIFVETLHGIFRALVIAPWIGDFRSRQVGVFLGSILILLVALLFIRWINAGPIRRLVLIGAMWLILTISFELTIGLVILGLDRQRMIEDYDVSHGGLMPFGLLFLLFTALIADRLNKMTA